jgi:hypothetical protein
VLVLKNCREPLVMLALPPLITMPAPLKLTTWKLAPWPMVNVKADAPGLNVQPPKVVVAENDRLVMLDILKKAVPVGTAAAFQLAAVLKSPEPGVESQVASCARADPAATAHRADDASKTARIRQTAQPDFTLFRDISTFRGVAGWLPCARSGTIIV